MEKRIGILVPCYNVGFSIKDVLNSFSSETLEKIDQIVVIDNFSEDDTVDNFYQVAKKNQAVAKKLVLIRNKKNYGLGGSQKIAYDYFIQNGFTHFLIVHGDNQGDGDLITSTFLEDLDENPERDVIFASRFLESSNIEDYSLIRKLGNYFFNFLTWVLTGHFMSDSGCGIILYRVSFLKELPFQSVANSNHFNPELNILIYNKAKSVGLVPLTWKDAEVASKLNTLLYCWHLTKILFKYRWRKMTSFSYDKTLNRDAQNSVNPEFEVIECFA